MLEDVINYNEKIKRFHFIGIAGTGMSSIAEILHAMGYVVTGSDISKNSVIERLKKLGIKVEYGHDSNLILNSNVVVYSTALKKSNTELKKALKMKIPVLTRAEMLQELLKNKKGIAVSGTHGKTTTTSMISEVLINSRLDPIVVSGGKMKSLGTGGRYGKGEYIVVEACESDGSFVFFNPYISVITNIELDHVDYYKNLVHLRQAFLTFANKTSFNGCVILNYDDPEIRKIVPLIRRRIQTYGLSKKADLYVKNIHFEKNKAIFELFLHNNFLGEVSIGVSGEFNVRNAIACVLVGMELGLSFQDIMNTLNNFHGVDRRFEIIGETPERVLVIDDYAHHPSEIKYTLKHAKKVFNRRIFAVLQPHRYSRTKIFYKEFSESLKYADISVVTEIYPAGEKPIKGVTGKVIVDELKKIGQKNVYYVPDLKSAFQMIKKLLQNGDLLITLGAGDVNLICKQIFNDSI